MFRAVTVTMIVFTPACYSFSESSVARPGETARVTHTTAAPAGTGRDEPIRVEGLVVSSSVGPDAEWNAGIRLARREKEVIGGFREVVRVDTVEVLQTDLRLLEVRSFSWVKSGAGAIVVGLLAATLVDSFMGSVEVR